MPWYRITPDGKYGKHNVQSGAGIGILYNSGSEGDEQELWQAKLVNVPRQAFVSNSGKAVITIGTWGPPQDKHAIVVYGAKGEVLADYSPDDLLTAEELQKFKDANKFPRKQSVASLWLYQAEFSFPNEEIFVIRSGKGAEVVIDQRTGNARRNGIWLAPKP